MTSSRAFFEGQSADRLMDPAYYPPAITEFLRQERKLLNTLRRSCDLLIEVGCMDGRYLDWAVKYRKRYLGIDLVPRHIEAGRHAVAANGLSKDHYRFTCGDAEELALVIKREDLPVAPNRCLILFPFNLFGAIPDVERVLASLRQSQMPFLISSYQTTEDATMCRYEYYQQCGSLGLCQMRDERGVSFVTSDGLCTIAYDLEYLQTLCRAHSLSVTPLRWSRLNMAYFSHTLVPNLRQRKIMGSMTELAMRAPFVCGIS
jgi:hypothetical protein